jgi:hypothetical protein
MQCLSNLDFVADEFSHTWASIACVVGWSRPETGFWSPSTDSELESRAELGPAAVFSFSPADELLPVLQKEMHKLNEMGGTPKAKNTREYPKVSGLAAWRENSKWYSSLPLQLYRYFVSQSSEFCRHNPLCCFSTSVYCCKRIFRYDSVRKLLDTRSCKQMIILKLYGRKWSLSILMQ